MHQQPNDRSCANEAIGGDHWGPVQIYMAQVDDAASDPGYDAGWFKVSEMGLPSNNPEYWVSRLTFCNAIQIEHDVRQLK